MVCQEDVSLKLKILLLPTQQNTVKGKLYSNSTKTSNKNTHTLENVPFLILKTYYFYS